MRIGPPPGGQDAVDITLNVPQRHGGDVLLVHWVGKKGPVAKPSEASERLLVATAGFLKPIRQERNAAYRLDLARRI